MLSEAEARSLIDGLLEEEALVLGGLAAVHDVDDDLIWRLMQNLDVIRGKTLRRLRAMSSEDPDPAPRPHPAIQDFLAMLGRD